MRTSLQPPSPPFLRGIFYATHRITRINKMNIPIRSSEANRTQRCELIYHEKTRIHVRSDFRRPSVHRHHIENYLHPADRVCLICTIPPAMGLHHVRSEYIGLAYAPNQG